MSLLNKLFAIFPFKPRITFYIAKSLGRSRLSRAVKPQENAELDAQDRPGGQSEYELNTRINFLILRKYSLQVKILPEKLAKTWGTKNIHLTFCMPVNWNCQLPIYEFLAKLQHDSYRPTNHSLTGSCSCFLTAGNAFSFHGDNAIFHFHDDNMASNLTLCGYCEKSMFDNYTVVEKGCKYIYSQQIT